MQNVKGQKGFTLIEVTTVLILIGLLAAFAIPKFFAMQSEAAGKAYAAAQDELNAREKQAWSIAKMQDRTVAFSDEDHVWNPLMAPAGVVDLGPSYTWTGTLTRNNANEVRFKDSPTATLTRQVSTDNSPGRWTLTYTPTTTP